MPGAAEGRRDLDVRIPQKVALLTWIRPDLSKERPLLHESAAISSDSGEQRSQMHSLTWGTRESRSGDPRRPPEGGLVWDRRSYPDGSSRGPTKEGCARQSRSRQTLLTTSLADHVSSNLAPPTKQTQQARMTDARGARLRGFRSSRAAALCERHGVPNTSATPISTGQDRCFVVTDRPECRLLGCWAIRMQRRPSWTDVGPVEGEINWAKSGFARPRASGRRRLRFLPAACQPGAGSSKFVR